jgi:hypothetical protein
MPRVVLVHGLEIVGAQHQDHQRQRRVDLDALGEAAAPSCLESSLLCANEKA